MINVTKTFLPPQNEYNTILKRAWDADWMTNRGELVIELEEKLKKFLGVSILLATTNGTLPLLLWDYEKDFKCYNAFGCNFHVNEFLLYTEVYGWRRISDWR